MAKILIVDDEQSFRQAAERYFELKGWTVFSARDGVEAIDFLTRNARAIDGVILDRNMPVRSGDEVVTWLYDNQLLGEICVVMLTAYGDLNGAVAALRMGAWQYLQKPVDLGTIGSLLAPGIAMKRCNAIRRELLFADGLASVVERLERIVSETLAPDLFHYFPIPVKEPTFTASNRRFVKKILDGAPFVSAKARELVGELDPVLPKAGSLMAVGVQAGRQVVGVLAMESHKEDGIDARWQEVLAYCADLVGLSQTIAEASRQRAKAESEQLILVNRELRHCLATSVHILGSQTRAIAKQVLNDRNDEQLLERVSIVEKHVDNINAVMDSLRRFADQLLQLEIRHDDVPLSTLVSRVVMEFKDIADKSGVMLTVSEGTPDIVVHGEERWIQYCLECILQNALEAIQDLRGTDSEAKNSPQCVRVICEADDRWARVEIADSGIGFDDEVRGRLFAPLFSTKSRLSSGGKNEGVGLYTAKRVIEQHGGRIDARSRGELQGATFSVFLPRRPAADAGREGGLWCQ